MPVERPAGEIFFKGLPGRKKEMTDRKKANPWLWNVSILPPHF
jgi:hypothetical protein